MGGMGPIAKIVCTGEQVGICMGHLAKFHGHPPKYKILCATIRKLLCNTKGQSFIMCLHCQSVLYLN